MKKSFLLLSLLFTIATVFAQTVPGDSIKYYEGKKVVVCEKVADTHITTSDMKITYLNFGSAYPNQMFTAVIFETDLPKFNYVPAEYLKGKKICLTGVVKIYKNRPEIVISSPDQIKIE
ncbi:MAG: hypothetical protein ABJC12_06535 [Saprospiraceae bacterium]